MLRRRVRHFYVNTYDSFMFFPNFRNFFLVAFMTVNVVSRANSIFIATFHNISPASRIATNQNIPMPIARNQVNATFLT